MNHSSHDWPSIQLLKSIIRRFKSLLIFSSLALFLITTLSYLNIQHRFDADDSQWYGKKPLSAMRHIPEYCYDPYRLPGYVERSELPEGPISSVTYIASNPSTKGRLIRPNGFDGPTPFVVPSLSAKLIKNAEDPEVQFLRNRTVIFIGDSLDRNEVYHLAQETFGPQYHRFLTPEDNPDSATPATQAHRVGVGVHPKLGFTVANWFLMSIDVEEPTSFFHKDEDLPQSFEGRFVKFYEPLLQNGLLKSPDMVVFNSGLWDLVYLSNLRDFEIDQNRTKGIPTKLQVTGEELLTKAEVEHHSARFRKFLNKLVHNTFNSSQLNDTQRKSAKPKPAKIRFVYRTMPDSSFTEAKSNAMSRKRVRQMDALNVQLIHEFNQVQSQSNDGPSNVLIDILDWKWISNHLTDELIDLVHFGRGATQWLYGDMVLNHLRRHIVGQETGSSWRTRPKNQLSSLLWQDCARFTSLVSSLNQTGSIKLQQSRSLFNH